MTQQYSSTIKAHYHHPRNTGKLSNYTHTAEAINPLCGDETKIYLKLEKIQNTHAGVANSRGRGNLPQSAIIQDISHETRGCMICVTAASVVSEFAKGKKLYEIKKLSEHNVAKLLNVSVSKARANCATLILDALKTA